MDVLRQCKYQQSSRKRPFTVIRCEYVVSARVQMQRMMPVWMAKVRRLVLRGSKSPLLAVYRHASSTFVMDEHPIRVMLLDGSTLIHAVGERGMVLTSSRVRRNDTWAMTFESSHQRRCMYELIKTWIELSAFLQSLTGFKSIARSESSVVYRCHDRTEVRHEYALKRVDKGSQEIELLEKLVTIEAIQPYVPRYLFVFEDGRENSVTIAMTHYKGGSLADRIREYGFLPDTVVRSVVSSLTVALHLLHQHGLLHLDVKAANVVFDADNSRSFRNMKLVDYGSSRPLNEPPTGQTVAGTYGCMAPEQFDGRYGPEADVYGVGVVLFHMITGEVPFVGVDTYQVMAKNMSGVVSFAHPRWRRVAPAVRDLAERLLHKDPAHRITLKEVLKIPWIGQTHSKEELHTTEASPPYPPFMTHSDPYAFFA